MKESQGSVWFIVLFGFLIFRFFIMLVKVFKKIRCAVFFPFTKFWYTSYLNFDEIWSSHFGFLNLTFWLNKRKDFLYTSVRFLNLLFSTVTKHPLNIIGSLILFLVYLWGCAIFFGIFLLILLHHLLPSIVICSSAFHHLIFYPLIFLYASSQLWHHSLVIHCCSTEFGLSSRNMDL